MRSLFINIYRGIFCSIRYFFGYCGVIDLVDGNENKVLTIGGVSGIFKERNYFKGRFERPPYNNYEKRSVYHIRNIDEFRLNSMPPRSVDIMLSHDWPSEIHKFGNKDELMPRFRCWFEGDPEYRGRYFS